METHVRSLIKSITWRVIATFTTMLLVFIFTRSLIMSLGVGSLEFVIKIIIYYLHERIWDTSLYGRKGARAHKS